MKSVNLYIPLLLLLFLAGACGTKKSDGASGALSDDALLDTVQRRTFNYFWDGAEPGDFDLFIGGSSQAAGTARITLK